jgi:hypothetical protein
MTELTQVLEERVRRLNESLTAKKAKRDDLDTEIRRDEELLRACELLLLDERGGPVDASQPILLHAEARRRQTISQAIIGLLYERGRAMHADEIRSELEARGMTFSAKDPKASVVTSLVRGTQRGMFNRTGRNRFELSAPQARLLDVIREE